MGMGSMYGYGYIVWNMGVVYSMEYGCVYIVWSMGVGI